MVEIKYIKELMTAMGRSGIKTLCLKKDDVELTLERGDTVKENIMDSPDPVNLLNRNAMPYYHSELTSRYSSELPVTQGSNITSEHPKQEVAGIYIHSPMVGTFYSSPDPDEPAFVRTGDKVDANTVVCIIEAMKVMNEIKAGKAGTVTEVLVEAGQPVEFGSKLFRIV